MLGDMPAHVTSSYLSWLGCTLAALTFASSSACTPEETTAERPGRGLDAPNAGAAGALPASEAPAAAGPRRSSPSGYSPSASSSFGGGSAPSGAAPVDPNAPQRDLSAELQAMMGQPLTCLAGAAPAPTVTVSVSTIVDAGGNVLRATASGPLTEEGLACMQARAAGVRFRAPVPRAPINVTARIAFRMTSPGTEATSTVIEEPRVLPPGAVDPMNGNAVPIAPRAGVPIAPRAGQAIEPRPGTAVEPTQGVTIMGPSGTPIGR
jgi:hypothetical protein